MKGRVFYVKAGVLIFIAIMSSIYVAAEEQKNVVTLTDCLEAALENGPDMRLSQTNLAISQAQYRQATAKNSLGLSGSAAASRKQPFVNTVPSKVSGGYSPFSSSVSTAATDTTQAGLSLSGPLTKVDLSASYEVYEMTPLDHSTKVSLSASQTLWDGYAGGRGLATVQQAELTLQGKRAAEDANRKSIAYQVKQAYYTLLADQRQLSVLQETLAKRREELVRTQSLLQTQNASQIDLKQAQVNARTAELDLRLAQSNLAVARGKLSELVGWPAGRPYTVAELEELPPPGFEVAEAVKTALNQRADLKQLRLNRASGDINLTLMKSQYSPTLSANGGLSWTRDWSYYSDLANWNAGLQVSIPIVDAGLRDAQLKEAAAQNQAYDLQEGKLAASIDTEVKNALYNLQDLLARAELAQATLDLAKDNYDLAYIQFQQGVSSNLDLLTASVNLTTAQVSLAKARSDAQLGVLALQNAMGE